MHFFWCFILLTLSPHLPCFCDSPLYSSAPPVFPFSTPLQAPLDPHPAKPPPPPTKQQKKKINTPCQSVQLHLTCLCETQDSLKESVEGNRDWAAVFTRQLVKRGRETRLYVYLDFWSHHQQHNAPRIFA